MGIKLNILYSEIARLIENREKLEVEGETVGECLYALVRLYPEAEKMLFDRSGQLARQVFVYVNAEGLNKAELFEPVKDGDTLIIAVLITGG
jgi:molybdopterin converting factor small subunit